MSKKSKIRHSGLISLVCFVLTLSLVNSITEAELTGWYEEGDRNKRINLTEIGTADWAYWGTQSLDKANEKAGAGEIGELTIIGTTSIDQTQWATSWDVDFSDGVEPVSGSANNVGNRLRLESASEVDEGYEIAVAAGAETRYLDIYFRQKNLVAKFVATLGDDVNEVFLEPPSGSTIHGIYRLDFSHPTASELRIRYFLPAGIAPYFGTESDSMRIGCMALSGPRGRAYKLYPKDGSTVDSATVDLQWLPGDYVGADGHRVYVDPNEQKVIDRSGCQVNGVVTTDPSYTVDLTVGETYYWAVDQVNDADPNSPWPGDVSSFTVTAPIYGPIPPDGKKGVHPDVAFLEWNAALAATSYDVYFGTDWNNVNDGTDGTHQGTVTDPRWAVTPSRLAETTTYYWRIDATIGTTTHKGDVWTFTTGIGVNIAWVSDEFGSGLDQDWVALLETQGFTVDYRRGEYWRTLDASKIATLNDAKLVIVSKATDSGEYSNSNSVGGEEEETLWNNITSPMILLNAMLSGADDWNWFDSNDHEWLGGAPIMEAVVPSHPIFDGVTLVGRKVDVLDETVGSGYTSFMQVTTAGNGTVYARTPDPNGWVWIVEWAKGVEFYDGAGQTAGDRRMYFFAGTGGFNPGIYNLTAEGEKVFLNAVDYMRLPVLKAFIPSPLDGATDVKQTPTLRWTPGDKAVQHDVYFGTDEASVAAADTATPTIYRGRQDLSSYVPTEAPLEWAKTYYWRIDEIEADGVTIRTGGVWSFTVADYLIIDDFEDYTNYQPDDIFSTWSDGYNIDENGALIGYDEPDFVETEIVHGGKQSMPYFYDNRGMVKYSEASHTLTDTRDWTEQGVKALSLWFRGFPPLLGGFVEAPAGTFTMSAEGADIWGSSDEFHFAWQQLSGEGEIIVKVESVEDTHPWAKAGIMIRDTLDPDSAFAMVAVTPGNGVWFGRRTMGNTASDTQTGITAPQWIKLNRSIGGLARASYSSDGINWTPLGASEAVVMNTPMYIGLALTSHEPGVPCEAVFSNVTSNGTGPWINQDIGLTSNEAEPMYVSISNNNGTTGTVYYDDNQNIDPDATLIDTWTEWNIDLKDFLDQGFDLSNVNSITIGIGDKDDPQPGGSGKMFFDDIRLYQPRYVPGKATPLRADFTGDGIVNDDDLQIMLNDWLMGDYTIYATPPGPAMSQWELDNNVNDSAGGIHGTTVGNPTYAAGKSGQAINLDGDDYVDLGNPAELNFGTVDWSITAWVKTAMTGTGDANKGVIYAKGGDRAGGIRYGLYVNENQAVQGSIDLVTDDNTDKREAISSVSVSDGQWHHIVGQRVGDTINVYIDGILDGTANLPADYDLSGTSQHNAYIGVVTDNSLAVPEKYLVGSVDDVRIYDYALSQAEILDVMGQNELYFPLTSPANIYDEEPVNSKQVNEKDRAILDEEWLQEIVWPEW